MAAVWNQASFKRTARESKSHRHGTARHQTRPQFFARGQTHVRDCAWGASLQSATVPRARIERAVRSSASLPGPPSAST
eukprot:3521807-Pyramimonas_sp.AAC.1